ncbi:UNVERIFIED_CONTAM: hypothetical protein RMT77_008605 [Armadillidium vulgare]
MYSYDLLKISKEDKPSFIKGLKNPCWYDKSSKKSLKCLPYFFILGQPKSGTTDLYKRLVYHPDIIPPVLKGVNFWTRPHFKKVNTSIQIQNTFKTYLSQFSPLTNHLQRRCGFGNVSAISHQFSCKSLISLDASTSTLWDNNMIIKNIRKVLKYRDTPMDSIEEIVLRRHKKGNFSFISKSYEKNSDNFPFTVADIIRKVLPMARFIVILRDPVERLYSGYKYFKQWNINVSPAKFDSVVNESMKLWRDCLRKHSEKFCAYEGKCLPLMKARLHVGLYSVYLKDWFKVFPRNQFLVIRTEDYKINISSTLQRIYKHLGLRNLPMSKLRTISKMPFANRNKVRVNEMLNETRKRIKNFYQRYNEELAELLNDQRFLWDDVP